MPKPSSKRPNCVNYQHQEHIRACNKSPGTSRASDASPLGGGLALHISHISVRRGFIHEAQYHVRSRSGCRSIPVRCRDDRNGHRWIHQPGRCKVPKPEHHAPHQPQHYGHLARCRRRTAPQCQHHRHCPRGRHGRSWDHNHNQRRTRHAPRHGLHHGHYGCSALSPFSHFVHAKQQKPGLRHRSGLFCVNLSPR